MAISLSKKKYKIYVKYVKIQVQEKKIEKSEVFILRKLKKKLQEKKRINI